MRARLQSLGAAGKFVCLLLASCEFLGFPISFYFTLNNNTPKHTYSHPHQACRRSERGAVAGGLVRGARVQRGGRAGSGATSTRTEGALALEGNLLAACSNGERFYLC